MHEQTTIRCLIVDDEPPARKIIGRYIADIPNLQLLAECSNAVQALSFLQQKEVDLIFLDVRMPQLNGNDFLKILKNPPKVILTTAYAEYALEGYELDVVDYLMKPVKFDRFIKAVNKAFELNHKAYAEISVQAEESKKENPFVYFRADRKMIKVMLSDILYIESMKDYIKVVTVNGNIITKQSISSVEAMLPETRFIRSHRSFIVSLHRINSFTTEVIEIEKQEIPIGKLYKGAVLKVLG
jgi:two-component system LytT family response regulator